jgi:hypothetical protein
VQLIPDPTGPRQRQRQWLWERPEGAWTAPGSGSGHVLLLSERRHGTLPDFPAGN